MNINNTGTLIMVASAAILLITLGITALSVVRAVTRSRKSTSGERMRDTYQRLVSEHPSMAYPVVSPTWSSSCTLMLSLAALIFGLGLIVAGVFIQGREIQKAQLLAQEGIRTSATVIDKEISEDDDGNETYYIRFAFIEGQEANRNEVQHRQSVPKDVYNRAEHGGRIEIIYAPSNPRIARITATYVPNQVSYWPLTLLGGVGVLLLLFLPMSFKLSGQAQRLDTEGVTVTTSIVDLYESSDSDGSSYYVAYEVPSRGHIRHGVSRGIYRRLRVGETITVRYLPDNPKLFRPVWPKN